MANIKDFYKKALEHRESHLCGAVPYQNGDFLTKIVKESNAKNILEVGTGVGYSTACLLLGNNEAFIETIDKDSTHINLAKENLKNLDLIDRVEFYEAKAEDILPTLTKSYDLIFYDGFVPQKKFVAQFERLLKKGGILLSANLFLSQPSGGRYLKMISGEVWDTKVVEDTAISKKV